MTKIKKANEELYNAGLRVVQAHLLARKIELDMNAFISSSPYCGSAKCIGGWLSVLVMHEKFGGNPLGLWDVSAQFYRRLENLFFPVFESGKNVDYRKLTSKQAVKAIQNFLEGSKFPWYDVLSEKQQDQMQ